MLQRGQQLTDFVSHANLNRLSQIATRNVLDMFHALTQRTDQHRAHHIPDQDNHQQRDRQRGNHDGDRTGIGLLVSFDTLLRQDLVVLKPGGVIFLELVLIALGGLIDKAFEVAGGEEDHQLRQRIVIGLVVRLQCQDVFGRFALLRQVIVEDLIVDFRLFQLFTRQCHQLFHAGTRSRHLRILQKTNTGAVEGVARLNKRNP